jgi:hypothetical protein
MAHQAGQARLRRFRILPSKELSMKLFPFACLALTSLLAPLMAASRPVVALDCFHNNENSPHYTWQLTAMGGYSQLAAIVHQLDADTLSITTALDSAALAEADVLIIVDPDTPAESADPQYISDAEGDALEKWVRAGGRLMLLANNKGNCEFTRFNVLAARFGITFNQDTQAGTNFGPLPQDNPLFAGCDTVHIKEGCTLTLTDPAEAAFSYGGHALVATATIGTQGGRVFALGDPWVYNEYMGSKDNEACVTNVMRWLLPAPTAVNPPRSRQTAAAVGRVPQHTAGVLYQLNGRVISSPRLLPHGSGRINSGTAVNAHGVYVEKPAAGNEPRPRLR